MGWTGGTEDCAEGKHGTSLDVSYVLWGLRDGMDRWDRGWGLDVLYVPWGLKDGIDVELC